MTPRAAKTPRLKLASVPPPNVATGRYELISELGRGGMGIVYKARDRKLDRLVAIKILPDEQNDDRLAREQFRNEARAAAAIDHENVCTIFDFGSNRERHLFVVMAYYAGETLKDRLLRGDLSTAQVASIALHVSRGLDAAHSRGIVHRDVKPGNIFITATGVVKVLDFGLARRSNALDDGAIWLDDLDIPGRPAGTANYMAPERILDMPVDGRSDVFSLGVVMYEMASRRRPFAAASPADTVMNVLERDPLPLRRVAPRHPVALERIVHKALAKEPARRFQSAAQLGDALLAEGLAAEAHCSDSQQSTGTSRRFS